jgi:hypothetical protein
MCKLKNSQLLQVAMLTFFVADAVAFGPAASCACTVSGDGSTAIGQNTTATGHVAVAMGQDTIATGLFAFAVGYGSFARGSASVALGQYTQAQGLQSFAMGYKTVAKRGYSTALGYQITTDEQEALVNSGAIHGKSMVVAADERLVTDVKRVQPFTMLQNVQSLKVTSHIPSANYCRHQNLTAKDCAASRTIGLLAQDVAKVVPEAVVSVSSLKLTTPQKLHNRKEGPKDQGDEVLEHVDALQSLDLHVMVAQLVGAVQAQASQMEEYKRQIDVQAAQIRELQTAVAATNA